MSVYRVEIDDDGCPQCQHDRTFHVIGPDEVASSTSYGDQEEAESLARALDRAYELGQASVKVVPTDPWTRFADQPPTTNGFLFVWDEQFKAASSIYYTADGYPPKHLAAMNYTHWMPSSSIPGPRGVPDVPSPTIEPPTTEPPATPLTPNETSVIRDWDDIPF